MYNQNTTIDLNYRNNTAVFGHNSFHDLPQQCTKFNSHHSIDNFLPDFYIRKHSFIFCETHSYRLRSHNIIYTETGVFLLFTTYLIEPGGRAFLWGVESFSHALLSKPYYLLNSKAVY